MCPKELMLRNPMVDTSVLFVITGNFLRLISDLIQEYVMFVMV